jgi:hypothetical protein
MRKTIWAAAGALAALALPAWAAAPISSADIAARTAAVARDNADLLRLDTHTAAPGARHGTASGQASLVTPAATTATGDPATPFANAYRAYPPSCLADPLPFAVQGPVWSKNVVLAAYNPNTNGYSTETVAITIWRVPCEKLNDGSFRSATLVGIDRATSLEGTAPYPLFPGLRMTQGGNSLKLVRIATEPNTVLSHVNVDTPVITSQTFVLENFASTATSTAVFNFNQAFDITYYNYFAGDTGQTQHVDPYAPNATDYPNAYKPLPITGYLSGNWYDPNHNGEGMLIQTFELPGDTSQYVFTFAWFTYDANGLPYWLFGGTNVPAGTRGPITVPTTYNSNGGFAGNFGTSSNSAMWGNVTFNFNNCGSVTFNYASTTTAEAPPKGSGTRTWTKPIDINAIPCD